VLCSSCYSLSLSSIPCCLRPLIWDHFIYMVSVSFMRTNLYILSIWSCSCISVFLSHRLYAILHDSVSIVFPGLRIFLETLNLSMKSEIFTAVSIYSWKWWQWIFSKLR
jgi:hypothetical protein